MKDRHIEINEKGHLVFGGCDTVELAKHYGTPLYVMDEAVLRANMRECVQAMELCFKQPKVYYASKAFSCGGVYTMCAQEGLGVDVVSAGELATALNAGFDGANINYHGNAKTRPEIAMAVEHGCEAVIDGLDELPVWEAECERQGRSIRALVRVTPGIEAHTHEYIRTGTEDSKFALGIDNGMALTAIKFIIDSPNMEFDGIHCHIGSQILDSEGFYEAGKSMAEIALKVKKAVGVFPRMINMGGGFGIMYIDGDNPLPVKDMTAAIAKGLYDVLEPAGEELPAVGIEPGRFIVGEAGITLYTVMGVKDVPEVRKFVSVDGGMTDNPRVMLYQAEYDAIVADRADASADDRVSIAGRYCETGDMLIFDIDMASPVCGDTIAVFSTGAYNHAMASNYNKTPIPPVVLVSEGRHALMVKGQTIEDMYKNDVQPEWL